MEILVKRVTEEIMYISEKYDRYVYIEKFNGNVIYIDFTQGIDDCYTSEDLIREFNMTKESNFDNTLIDFYKRNGKYMAGFNELEKINNVINFCFENGLL